MELAMTEQGNTPAETLLSWWNEIAFDAKDKFELKSNGELVLKPVGNAKERVVGTLAENNAAIVLKALVDKFPEIEAKFNELSEEWEKTEDKQKLAGKVERMREYLQHTNAVGDFTPLFDKLLGMETVLHKLADEHYAAKLKIVEQAEQLSDSNNWKEVTQQLKDIVEHWKNTGFVDKHRNDQLWDRLEAARTKFFDRKREHQEDINKELLQNLDLKMELVEKAEKLAASEEWKDTTEAFHNLMEEWKKTGRTVADKNEALWNRFITAKNVFFDKKKQHFETIQQEHAVNYAAKEAIIQKAEALKDSTEWNKTTDAYAALMEEWKKIGRVGADKSDELWNRFNAAKDVFFTAKKHHFETMKVSLDDNYAQKLALLKRAESLQHSTRWKEATDEMIELMEEWKKVGPVPRKFSDTIWEQFSAARKKFFERKDANREHRKQQAEKYKSQKAQQAFGFLRKLEDELREEEDRLEDFRNGLLNITPGKKAEELREHLEKLIRQTEHKIQHKQEKIEEMRKQMEHSADEPNLTEESSDNN